MADLEPKDVLEAGAKALFGPVNDLFMKLTGPAAEEYGLMWAESVRIRRTKRLVSGLVKTKRMVEEAGFDPRVLPDKLLLPIFEGMSMEDDEELHTMWAALLANAASPEGAHAVRPGFIAILRQMAPDEAMVLKWFHDRSDSWKQRRGFPFFDVMGMQVELGFVSKDDAQRISSPDSRFMMCLDGLEGQQLICKAYWQSEVEQDPKIHPSPVVYSFTITERGHKFLDACCSPKPKSKPKT